MTLTGSEKQVKWAEEIAQSALDTLAGGLFSAVIELRGQNCDDIMQHMVKGEFAANKQKLHDLELEAAKKLTDVTDASWWINNRPQRLEDHNGPTALWWYRKAMAL